MSDYGVIFTDEKGTSIDTYLNKYVIDVVKASSTTSKEYPGVKGLEAIIISSIGFPGVVKVVGNKISWSTPIGGNNNKWLDTDAVIVMADRGSVKNPSDSDYGVFLTDNDGNQLFPYSLSTYVFYKKLDFPSSGVTEFDLGIPTSDPMPLLFTGGDNLKFTNLQGGNGMWKGTSIRLAVSNNKYKLRYNLEQGVGSVYIFMPSYYVFNKVPAQDKITYGAVAFNEDNEIQFISGQTPLEIMKAQLTIGGGDKDFPGKPAAICAVIGMFTLPDHGLGAYLRVLVTASARDNKVSVLREPAGMMGGPMPGEPTTPATTYYINRLRYE